LIGPISFLSLDFVNAKIRQYRPGGKGEIADSYVDPLGKWRRENGGGGKQKRRRKKTVGSMRLYRILTPLYL
jgi:hypothetical protein